MNVLIAPGYGDGRNYIDRITRHWPEKFRLNPRVVPFGTVDLTTSYAEKWESFEKTLRECGRTAMIGISFGVSVALRALQDHPELVSSVVCISGPHRLEGLDQPTIKRKYPLLNDSLETFSVEGLPLDRIMTIRPLRDGTIDPSNVPIEGGTNLRVPIAGHATGIAWALKFKADEIAQFIKTHQ